MNAPSDWQPTFACPACRTAVPRVGRSHEEKFCCSRCRRFYGVRDGIYRFLDAEALRQLEPFLQQYAVVRRQDRHRGRPRSFYRDLPNVGRDDPDAVLWAVRQSSYAHLTQRVLPRLGDRKLRILDVGAGNGWLSSRLAEKGHRLVAVDCSDADDDGLGAYKMHDADYVSVQAHFDHLPFAPAQFDAVLFNGSLHYAADPEVTLRRALRLINPGGLMAVLDSPMFTFTGAGEQMRVAMTERFARDYGLEHIVWPGTGYLTFRGLSEVANAVGWRSAFIPSSGGVMWALGRWWAGVKLRRQPARFGVWVLRDYADNAV